MWLPLDLDVYLHGLPGSCESKWSIKWQRLLGGKAYYSAPYLCEVEESAQPTAQQTCGWNLRYV